ncbi:Pyruvate/2-oxoglutarate dehydrogenase complex, dihydrolipoamide dehydrogenase (E3) component [Desulfocicer vacuolatum DSM 3385]|uniref:Pyruvate/2-oxoglutarate dehydrogenase complex, dihydrolipoamide dehydrogenase (E3) component n=1 Tax=Desulfocicer vacuolatum DSM 3385 TaxID=1121400 RepID=A0A1W2DGY5_9BACT|nr:bifunctional TVP38/TMEM64 family protein/FAD-dependent oxidoreductase [Desulfocicer vacuolatum]SMC96584.1 Pyruvate/2-oxoglutarate dehydrogenase complex, dihydrolipoamide dehydrogenase (E3) component [Desulfocicer vacuolatum DSM 3385]
MTKSKSVFSKGKSLVVIAVLCAVGLFFMLDLHHYFSLSSLKARQVRFQAFYDAHAVFTMGLYMAAYITMAALSLPGAAVMTLAAGALFGLFTGTLLAVISSTIGATLAFLVSRFLFRDYIQRRFKDKLKKINRGLAKEGAFYLLTLRLVPIFPFFIINLVMGVTAISTRVFAGVSLVGMLGGCMVYVNAGTQLARIDSVKDIVSPGILFAFMLLGLFSLVAKKAVDVLRRNKALSQYRRPGKFDYNLVVLGAGSAGLVTSYIAAAVKAKVALVEKHKMGGDCLNTGCVPSKAFIRSARILSQVNRAGEFGFDRGDIKFNFKTVMERVQKVIKTIAPHDSVDRYTDLGVECIQGKALIKSPWEVEVNHRVLTTRNIVVATGARPMIPDLPGLDSIPFYTSDTIWEMEKLPRRLMILGGGPIGCELAQAFAGFGARVILVQRGAHLMKREDPEVSDLIKAQFESQGIEVFTHHGAKAVVVESDTRYLVCTHNGEEVKIAFDEILVALGRQPNVTGFGLEELGVRLTPRGTIDAGEFMETSIPTIFCAGDVAGPYQFTHVAAHQSWYASVNALFGGIKKFRVDYNTIPWATFTHPEVARVGLNETDARAKNIEYEVTRYNLDDLDRAIADGEARGFVKVLTVPEKDKILGVTLVGSHAGEIIAEFVLAMKAGLGLNKILGTIHIYPTMAEANKYVAGAWKRAHKPEKLLSWVEKFHSWRRK